MLAPVTLFVYNRTDHTQKTVEALLRNELAAETDLIVFSDAARTPSDVNMVANVRAYVAKISGFRSVSIHHRNYNYGLSRSIISGVTNVLDQYDRVIVMEDDLVTSPFFLKYMNEALDQYAEDDRVISIHGYVYPTTKPLPEAFFLRGADCWGWATWSRGWSLFNPDGQKLLNELRLRDLTSVFDFGGSSSFTKMLEGQIKGLNDSWAVRWYASAFLAGKLTLYPGRSLVHNIGNDSSGTHCGKTDLLDVSLSPVSVCLDKLVVKESSEARILFKNYFLSTQNRLSFKCILNSVMTTNLRRSLLSLAKQCLPPVLINQLRRLGLIKREGIVFKGPYRTWEEAVNNSSGYDSEQILERVLSSALKVKSGDAVYERDSFLFDEIQYSWPVTAGLMWAAACCKGELNVLDFGGSLGSSYFQNRNFLHSLKSVRWSVVEQPHFVETGQRYLQNNELKFYSSISDCINEQSPNLIIVSSVIEYLSNPEEILSELADIESPLIIIDRSPFSKNSLEEFFVQVVPSNIFTATIPLRTTSFHRLSALLQSKSYRQYIEYDTIGGSYSNFEYKGFLFFQGAFS